MDGYGWIVISIDDERIMQKIVVDERKFHVELYSVRYLGTQRLYLFFSWRSRFSFLAIRQSRRNLRKLWPFAPVRVLGAACVRTSPTPKPCRCHQ